MINAITNNPYRILGVYSNSPKKEQIANQAKIKAFLRVNKNVSFLLDLTDILPPVERNQDAIDHVESELSLLSGKIRNAQFWFINNDPIDTIVMNRLFSGNIEYAMKLLQNKWKGTMSFLQNLFVCYLIKGDYESAIINCAIPLYEKYSDIYIKLIDENANVQKEELIHNIIQTLFKEGIDLLPIIEKSTNELWIELALDTIVGPLITKINASIEKSKSTKGTNGKVRLNAGIELMSSSNKNLKELRHIIGYESTRYKLIADKIAQEVLQCSIDYFNSTNDYHASINALPLCEYALSIAVGDIARQRCQQNFDIVKNIFENLPPEEVIEDIENIEWILSKYSKLEKTTQNSLNLLMETRGSLVLIKEMLGQSNSYYLNISSKIGNVALNYLIEDVNNAQKKDNPNPLDSFLGGNSHYGISPSRLYSEDSIRKKAILLKNVLHNAWKTILYLDLMDKTDEFDDRFQSNRKTLHTIINSYKGFSSPDYSHIIQGCAFGLAVDKHFFWSDTELYESCDSKEDYKRYLSLFNYGKYANEAKEKMIKLEKFDRKVKLYTFFAIIILLILLVIIVRNIRN